MPLVAEQRETMNIAEIPYDSGEVQFRYERRWNVVRYAY